MAKNYRNLPLRGLILLTILLGSFVTGFPAGKTLASSDALRWSVVPIPTEGRAGNWTLAAASDVQHPTAAIDGTLYAYGKGLTYTLYKSTNGGYGWSYAGNVRDIIVDIATSPRDADTVYYATVSAVYRSTDGGKSFAMLPAGPGGAGSSNIEIVSLAASWANFNVVAVGTRDTDAGQFGGVYTLEEDKMMAGWVDSGLSYDVYALAFSPNYAGDRQLVAVATNETDTYVTMRAGHTGWGAAAGNARLNRDNAASPAPVATTNSAAIAFPADYDFNPASGNCVLFVAVDTGSGNGDVYRINGAAAPNNSSATDLNVGSAYGIRNLDVTGLALTGNANSARLLAGCAAGAQTYSSSDGGRNWTRSSKEPTGGSATYVLSVPGPGARLYAATSGTESALSISLDSGATWNQVGLVDTGIGTIVDVSPSPSYAKDGTLFLLTFGGKHSLWRTTNDAATWERVFSSALPNIDSLSMAELAPGYGSGSQVVFLAGSSNGQPVIMGSTDNGRKFAPRPALDPASGAPLTIDAWAVAGDKTLCIAAYDGSNAVVYPSDNGGFFYSQGVPVGSQPLNSLALSPSYEKDGTLLAGDANGGVYWSADNGTSFAPLPPGAAAPPLSGAITVTFDARFNTNKTVYAASSTANKGIYRFIIGKSPAWESIDSTLPSGGMVNQLSVSGDGVLYGANSRAGGGMERTLDPNYPLGPVFDSVTRSLAANATLVGLWQSGHRLWSVDSTNLKLMSFTDTLTSAPAPDSPKDGASGAGSLVDHTIKNVSVDWATLPEATSYQWQLNYNRDFSPVPTGFEGTTESSSARLPTLEPGTTYYWRVRASAPVLSPWSAKRSFTTSLDTEVVPLRLESPTAGAAGVPVKPTFQWGAVAGADAYEVLVAADASFAVPALSRSGSQAVRATSWQADMELKSETVHYWKVRAVNSSTASAWSPVSAFTTGTPPRPLQLLWPPPPTAPATVPPIPQAAPPSAVPAAPLPSSPPPPATVSAPVPAAATQLAPLNTMLGWIPYLFGGLLLTIVLLIVVILMLVVRTRRA